MKYLFVMIGLCVVTNLSAISQQRPIESSSIAYERAMYTASPANEYAHKSPRQVRRMQMRELRQLRRAARKSLVSQAPRKDGAGEGLAIASLVLGIVGLLLQPYLILSLLALIFGSIAMKRYKEGYHDRKGAARAGQVMGIIGVAVSVVLLAVFATFWV